ncbi:hypothetical protein [Flavobacterium sp. JP2137]
MNDRNMTERKAYTSAKSKEVQANPQFHHITFASTTPRQHS